MNLIQKAYSATTETLEAKRQVKVVVSTGDIDRSGEIIVPDGITWKAYMATGAGPVLWNHNANMPIAKCIEIERQGNGIMAVVQFPPEGEDAESDKIYKRVKFGSIPGVSIGFQPVASEPLDKGNPVKGPQRYLSTDMMEFSFTPIPCNPSAVVVDKTTKATVWKVGASRNLAIGSGDGKDVLEFADFDSDSPDIAFARKGFLAYDAANPEDRSSYRLPFAKMVNGHMTVIPDLLKAAKAEIEGSDLPEDVAHKARAVIEHYEGKMTVTAKSVVKAGAKIEIKSLWRVSQLASILEDLVWLKDCLDWDAIYDERESSVPAAVGSALVALGEALLTLTAEEVAAVLGEQVSEETESVTKGICAEGAAPIVKTLVAHHIKAGRKFSASSISTMQDACKAIKEGHDAISALMEEPEASDTEGTEKSAEADRAKAIEAVKQKRIRELEVLRLKQPL